jgi:hypothetical protein
VLDKCSARSKCGKAISRRPNQEPSRAVGMHPCLKLPGVVMPKARIY